MSQKARDYLYPLQQGARVYPEDLAGVLGIPHIGNIYYVDANNGSDSANSGETQDDALATVSAAYDKTTDSNHDVVIVAPTSTTGRTSESSAITWSNDYTHLIGVAAPVDINARAGMSAGSSVSPLITISADGCIFANLTLASFNDNNILATVTGSRNRFHNVHFAGIGNATTGDDTSARCLYLNGGQENEFTRCNFGLDTIMRSTTNATVEFASSASRNKFSDCRFIMAADNVGPNHVLLTGSSAIDRWIEFNNCTWYTFWTNDADKLTHVFDNSGQSATGHILMTGRQVMVGADDWEASDADIMYFEPASSTANAIGIGINPSVS